MYELIVDSSAISSQAELNQIQIIFQRHCDYNEESGELVGKSSAKQKKLYVLFLMI